MSEIIKNKILEHSKARFFIEGFHRITIDELARDMQISKNTIYKYFDNKDDIILAVIRNTAENIGNGIHNIITSDNNSIHKLISILHLITETILKINVKFLNDIRLQKPQLWIIIDEMRKKILQDNIGALIRQGKKEKLINNIPDEIMLAMIIASLREVLNPEFLTSVNYSRADVVKIAFDFIANGMLTPKGKILYKKLSS